MLNKKLKKYQGSIAIEIFFSTSDLSLIKEIDYRTHRLFKLTFVKSRFASLLHVFSVLKDFFLASPFFVIILSSSVSTPPPFSSSLLSLSLPLLSPSWILILASRLSGRLSCSFSYLFDFISPIYAICVFFFSIFIFFILSHFYDL